MPRETRLGTWAQEAETPKPDEGLSGQRIVTLTALPPKDVAAMAAVVGAAREAMYVFDCRCFPDYTERGLHGPECLFVDGGPLRDALAAWDALEEAK